MRLFHLVQEFDAAIELIKGKFTTLPKYHSGEGLFFSSHAVDKLTICANKHCLELAASEVAFNEIEEITGTNVTVLLKKKKTRNINSVFDDYCSVNAFRCDSICFCL